MKSNLKRFFKITTITSYIKITSKIQEKGPFVESLKGKVISNSSFTLSNFLYTARNLEKTANIWNFLVLSLCTNLKSCMYSSESQNTI